MSHLTIHAKNFRVLERLEWSPEGVCLLAGANGAGKSTTLDALGFVRAVFLHGHEAAFSQVSGRNFRRVGTPEEDPVEFQLQVGDIRWRLRFPMSASGLRGQFGEELLRGDDVILRAGMFDEGWYLGSERRELDDLRCCAKVVWDMTRPAWMKPLVDALSHLRIYGSFELHHVKAHEPVSGVSTSLHGTGKNLWSVLSSWSQAPIKHAGKFQWVMQQARRAFPGIMGSLEFERGLPYLFGPHTTDPADGLPPERAADGLLTGLLHLTAVAGAQDGALIGFDEIENQLHPHAIHSLLAALRQQADERDLTIVLTTHSPVVMNEFKGAEDQFYVLGPPSPESVPRPLDELHDPDWLAHFVLGDLYERSQIVAPFAMAESPE